jgi:hypothetical protein
MSARQLFTLSLSPFKRSLHRWWLNRRLNAIQCHLDFIERERENDRHVERMLHAKQALLQSERRNA